MFKLIKWLAIAVVVLVVVAVVGVWVGLNAAVRKGVETAATSGLKTKTTVGSASVSPFGGGVSLSGLTLASPEGFTSPQMFSLGRVSVAAGLGKLFGEPVKIDRVTINQPSLVLEQAGGKLNVLALSDKLKGNGQPADPKAGSMKLVIGTLELTGASVTILPGIPGSDRTYHVALPDVTLADVGNGDGNQTGEELARVLNTVIATLAAKAAESKEVPEPVRQLLALDVGRAAERLEGKAKDEIKKVTDRLPQGLGDLLDRKKKP